MNDPFCAAEPAFKVPSLSELTRIMDDAISKSMGVPPSLLGGDGNYSFTNARRDFSAPFGRFDGLPVRFNCLMTEYRQVRFPRSKKVRIRRKWSKQSKNWAHAPSRQVICAFGAIWCHPEMLGPLKREIDKYNRSKKVTT